jgi:exodeoxyribonuclease V gamma subunit
MLQLTFSNRFEILLEALLQRLAVASDDPFDAQHVIVPSAALRRRIELSLTDRLGICANVRFSYLAQWLWAQIGRIVPVGEASPFAPELLVWRIFEAFGDDSFAAPHPRLARYLAVADPLMRFDLARHTAQLIGHYITYRPQWLEAWSDGRRAPIPGLDGEGMADAAWQSSLWRRILAELGAQPQHPSAAFFRTIEDMGPQAPRQAALPESAWLFCLPALPPLYLDILNRLSIWMHLELYALNPCREYWFEIVEPKRLSYLTARGRSDYHEVGNSLLAAWGRQTQAHIDLLLSGEGSAAVEAGSTFAESGSTRLLGRIQDAILNLHEIEPGSVALAPDDRSIEVHVCHSLSRELEVLHDQLLALFAGPDPPGPDEVLVVTPDLETAASLIDSVFGTVPASRRIPYAITGQPQHRVNPIARILDALMALAGSRHPASAVFDLLEQPPVRCRFGLSAQDTDAIHAWIRESGIRWGLDESERAALDLPAGDRHSFSGGLHKLFLAYALGDVGETVAGRIGSCNPEGQDAAALGPFWRYVDALRASRQDFLVPKCATGWQTTLAAALENFVAPDPSWAEDLRAVHAAIAELHEDMRSGGLGGPVPVEVVRSALAERVDVPARGGVPSGAVTFCAMGSLRWLPYRVICVVGMNDGAFPGSARPLEFDLMAAHPIKGDRQLRIDDRNLFFDLMLAARERFHMSYAGRSIRDNAQQPPSVLVAELLDYAIRACSSSDEQAREVRRRLVVEHPLQAFSRDYFVEPPERSDLRVRSFNTEYCDALRAPVCVVSAPCSASGIEPDEAEDKAQSPFADNSAIFFGLPLPSPEPEWRTVRLDDLIRFFRNPCRYLLRERLGIALPEREDELQDDEPFLPDRYGRQALAQRLLPPLLRGSSRERLTELAQAADDFPAGALGHAAIEAEIRLLTDFADRLRADLAEPPLAALSVSLDFAIAAESWRIEHVISDWRPGRLVRWRYDETRPADYLAGWIAHLFVCAGQPERQAIETRWHSRDGAYLLRPCRDAHGQLANLLVLYRQGLSAPLHFFPKTSWEYVVSGGSLLNARRRWTSTPERPFGEDRDPAFRLALRGTDEPIDEAFVALAMAVFGPLRDHLEDSRL